MIQYLKKLKARWTEYSLNNNIGSEIADDEEIARFLFSKSQFAKTKGRVKYNAFMPGKKNPDEVSVYRVSSVTNAEKWEIARVCVGDKIGKPPVADAVLLVGAVRDVKLNGTELRVEPETSPHPLHANITSWPKDRDKKMLAALELANQAVLNLAE